MREIKVGLIGLGTVGAGVVKVLQENSDLIACRLGARIKLGKIAVRDLSAPRRVKVDPSLLTQNVRDILEDPEIQIVIELIGGYEPAKSFILSAVKAGKHIVTANKALLAESGGEIFRMAEEMGVDIGFEASVGGGIPIIRSLREGFSANHIEEIFGIINGTANYILTEMTEKKEDFQVVLRKAQEMGLAEADPTLDIEGIDAASKIAILTYLAFGVEVKLDQIYTEGISGITPMDIDYAANFGYKIKLLAIAKRVQDALEVRVHPTMLSYDNPLAKVEGAFNAIYVKGDAVGPSLLYGKGAGMMPTASAVVGDIIEIGRNILKGIHNRVPLWMDRESGTGDCKFMKYPIRQPDEFSSRYYLRFTVVDRPGVLSKISGVLGNYGISIASVLQKERHPVDSVPVVILTHTAFERDVKKALSEIDNLPVVRGKTVLIRVEQEDETGTGN
ncbi:MAG TPA: homoserine dehydrogenase [Candidatus Limnocylindrales bacterium]|nr:homoserine dehydrogenase [Candidatus Limnocylindrales bacterium]